MHAAQHIAGERIARQGFATRPTAGVAAAAALVCGIQAQDPQASRLGVRARCAGATEADVLAAIDNRSVVRSWLMRNTIHLVPAEDVRWLTALLGPMIRRRFQNVRWPALGLTPELLESAAEVTPSVLAGRSLTRSEFAGALAGHGVRIDPSGQASTHALLYLSTIGMVCRGNDRGRSADASANKSVGRGEATFTLLDGWLPACPAGPTGDDALAELARRYFAAFSPATPADFTTWCGLPAGRAVDLIGDELTPVEVGGRAGYRLGEVEPERGLRLLSAFDNYLVGYRDRALIIDAGDRAEVYVGGIIRPTVLSDGYVVGRWSLIRSRESAAIDVSLYTELSKQARTALDAEVTDVGRFIALPTSVRLT